MNDFVLPLVYFAAISFICIIITVYDKSAAKLKKRRIPEKVLFLSAAAGGAASMLLTMKIIRHKTKHKRFMIGLPAIILLQVAAVLIYICR